MLSADEMPNDNAKLASIPVSFAHVPLDSVAAPETFVADILEYLAIEDFTPDDGLHFVRTADVEGTLYYIWRFACDGDDCFATVSIRDGSQYTGCNENHWGLTPEQFILADYHQCM